MAVNDTLKWYILMYPYSFADFNSKYRRMSMLISAIDHLVITVGNIETSCTFYQNVLGLEVLSFEDGRKALCVGDQKINLHEAGNELSPCAGHPTPGSADLCFITPQPIERFMDHLKKNGISRELGPVKRTGVSGPINSVYFRDPDQNLLEVSCYI